MEQFSIAMSKRMGPVRSLVGALKSGTAISTTQLLTRISRLPPMARQPRSAAGTLQVRASDGPAQRLAAISAPTLLLHDRRVDATPPHTPAGAPSSLLFPSCSADAAVGGGAFLPCLLVSRSFYFYIEFGLNSMLVAPYPPASSICADC